MCTDCTELRCKKLDGVLDLGVSSEIDRTLDDTVASDTNSLVGTEQG